MSSNSKMTVQLFVEQESMSGEAVNRLSYYVLLSSLWVFVSCLYGSIQHVVSNSGIATYWVALISVINYIFLLLEIRLCSFVFKWYMKHIKHLEVIKDDEMVITMYRALLISAIIYLCEFVFSKDKGSLEIALSLTSLFLGFTVSANILVQQKLSSVLRKSFIETQIFKNWFSVVAIILVSLFLAGINALSPKVLIVSLVSFIFAFSCFCVWVQRQHNRLCEIILNTVRNQRVLIWESCEDKGLSQYIFHQIKKVAKNAKIETSKSKICKKYDVIIMSNSLCHVNSANRQVKIIDRYLNDGGIIIAPAYTLRTHWLMKLLLKTMDIPDYAPIRLSKKKYIKQLKEAGFQVNTIQTFYDPSRLSYVELERIDKN